MLNHFARIFSNPEITASVEGEQCVKSYGYGLLFAAVEINARQSRPALISIALWRHVRERRGDPGTANYPRVLLKNFGRCNNSAMPTG